MRGDRRKIVWHTDNGSHESHAHQIKDKPATNKKSMSREYLMREPFDALTFYVSLPPTSSALRELRDEIAWFIESS